MTTLEYVGNDIVDLEEPTLADQHRRWRFIARVCDASEQDRVSRSCDPKVFLWSLFAAKEAAFKLAVKRFGPMPFSHRAFKVAADLRSVCFQTSRWILQLEYGSTWLHALVSTSRRAAFRVSQANGVPASDAARRLLTELGSKALACEVSLLSVARGHAPEHWDALGPPRLLHATKPTRTDVSLSHDGRFVAAALILQRE